MIRELTGCGDVSSSRALNLDAYVSGKLGTGAAALSHVRHEERRVEVRALRRA
jgi:hypothetical protein